MPWRLLQLEIFEIRAMTEVRRMARQRLPAGHGLLRESIARAAVLLFLVMMSCEVVGLSAASDQDDNDEAAALRLKICVVNPFQMRLADGREVAAPIFAKVGTTVVTAAKHISERNFTLIPDGAELLGSRRISLELVYVNLPSLAKAALAPLAVKTCSDQGAHYIFFIGTADYLATGTLVAQYYGMPFSTVSVSSPRLSDEVTFPMFHRTNPSITDYLYPATRLLRQAGLRKVAIIYMAGVGGEAMRNAAQEALSNEGIEFTAFGFPIGNDLQSYTTQLQALLASGIQVVLDLLRIDGVGTLCTAMDAMDMGETSLIWIKPSPVVELLQYHDYPRSRASSALENTMHGWLALAPPLRDNAPLQEACANTDLAEAFEPMIDARSGEPIDLIPQVYQLAREPMDSPDGVKVYDSIWAIAAALAKASRMLVSDSIPISSRDNVTVAYRKALALRAHEQITSGMVSFQGLSGMIKFKQNGDLDVNPDTQELRLINYVNVPNSTDGTPLQKRCAGVFRNREWELPTSADGTCFPITWSDGGVYPYVPHVTGPASENGAPYKAIYLFIIVGSAMVMLLALVAALLYRRNARLRERVKILQEDGNVQLLDMDSSVARMLRFLREYQHSATHPFAKFPTAAEAAALETYIIRHADSLSAPDLWSQLASKNRSKHFGNDGVYNFLLKEFTDRPKSRGVSRAPSLLSSIKSLAMPPTRAAAEGRCSQSFDDITQWRPLCPPETKQLLDSADFFLDAVTNKSPLRDCPNPLASVVQSAVESLGIFPESPDSTTALLLYTKSIEAGYLMDGYHCCNHAADVTNRLVALLHLTGIASASKSSHRHRQSMLAAVVCAAIHDYKHPQVNNGFLIDEESSLALIFNDFAVLEMQSLKSAFELLNSSPVLNFTQDWSKNDKNEFRKDTIQLVLATDMSSHFDLAGRFATQIGQNKSLDGMTGAEKWRQMGDRGRLLTLQVAMKIADIGHCYTYLCQHREWLQRLEEEFFKQGDLEKEAGRKPSPLMDRGLPGAGTPHSSVGFFTVIALPLISAWVEVFPECEPILKQAKANLAWWQTQIKD